MSVDDGLEPWVEGVWHDLEASLDAGDDEVGVVALAPVRAHGRHRVYHKHHY